MYGIILAGGSGSRLWPLSRELYPKQLLNLNADKSLLQSSFERLEGIMPVDNIISITNAKHTSSVKMQLKDYSKNAVVLSEPASKNTAPAIALATKYVAQMSSADEIIIVVPSDHLIEDQEKFLATVKKGENLAKQGHIVTFGIEPSYPETGYGYINTFGSLDGGYKVKEFVEKPDQATAEEYLRAKTYFWNSGIFMFKASAMLEQISLLAKDIAVVAQNIDFTNSSEIPFIEFDKMPNISIDYAIMEKSDKIALVKLESDWNDLGSWQSIYDVSEKDKSGNVFIGAVHDINSTNSFVYSSSKLVATIGLEDTVIVETEDAILACKKDKTQDVKQVYEALKKQNSDTCMVHKTVYRPWGFYTVIAQGKGFATKLIHVNQGQKLSVQSHNHRSEHWVVLSGKAKVLLDDKELILEPGHSVDIPVKAIHSLQNPFDEDIEIIEVQKGDILIEDDIIRYEDMYGRV
ncbi:MAG: mannose-1-phosphate guanylyltransferase/mannose-6-phosphate isomerase [Candidatus Gastranaerophilales bacterium]